VKKREPFWVGLFVLVAATVLVAVVLSVSGAFRRTGVTHRASFRFAAGLTSAAPVRFGGLLAGRVEGVRVSPEDSTKIEVEFRVRPDIPVKTDSVAKITSLGALGDSYLELTTGTRDAALAAPGSMLLSRESMAISDLGDLISEMAPAAQTVLHSLNDRLTDMKTTIANVNDLLNDRNRQNIAGSLSNLNGMLADTRPKLAATLVNVQAASDDFPKLSKNALAVSEKVAPLLDDFKATAKKGNETLAHLDAMLGENRPDIRASVAEIRKTMETASKAAELLRITLDRNGENLDESLLNVRAATDNLKEMTDTLKRKPSVLIRGETGKDRVPGATK
jgi:phospholipid/cholesterol/gamma-HCH transport system substrate-binding protein